MTLVKVGDKRFINVDRMTHVEPAGKKDLYVHFNMGGGGAPVLTKLKGDEARTFLDWLEKNGTVPVA